MFKKLLEKINQRLDRFESNVKANFSQGHNVMIEQNREIITKIDWLNHSESETARQQKFVDSQQRIIEALTNALCDKYNHGLFIYSEDGKIPMVIRNGKELTNDMTTEFSICWCPGEVPNIQIEQLAATHHEDGE